MLWGAGCDFFRPVTVALTFCPFLRCPPFSIRSYHPSSVGAPATPTAVWSARDDIEVVRRNGGRQRDEWARIDEINADMGEVYSDDR
jgi:hypothetical protein